MFDFESVLVVHSVHVHHRRGFEDRVELDGHAEATEHGVGVAVLSAERLVGDFETRWAVDGAVDPGHLRGDTLRGVGTPSVNDCQLCSLQCALLVFLFDTTPVLKKQAREHSGQGHQVAFISSQQACSKNAQLA